MPADEPYIIHQERSPALKRRFVEVLNAELKGGLTAKEIGSHARDTGIRGGGRDGTD